MRFPSGVGVQNPRPREISRSSCDVFPNTSLLLTVYEYIKNGCQCCFYLWEKTLLFLKSDKISSVRLSPPLSLRWNMAGNWNRLLTLNCGVSQHNVCSSFKFSNDYLKSLYQLGRKWRLKSEENPTFQVLGKADSLSRKVCSGFQEKNWCGKRSSRWKNPPREKHLFLKYFPGPKGGRIQPVANFWFTQQAELKRPKLGSKDADFF